uniref:BLOC-1-related complex subunit 5 n=1 Tax=Haptolina brevifila TaxID=156173 RepID=A0A7S2MEX0_9EUKA|mmetsp:Transcript_50782/g.101063  ORF Transcript_50782/g.101063 Transcript_50782/m.101063 type:complete len:166 (+) Transcript_50782:63-560(+)
MGASGSKRPAGIVTVSERGGTAAVDPDLAALQRLPPVSPLVRPPSLVNGLFSSRPDPSLPALQARNVSALCREYAAVLRQAALPICEEQRALAKKMSSVEALCVRVLYLMALRSTELTKSAVALRELTELRTQTGGLHKLTEQAMARAEALERRASVLSPTEPEN